MNGWKHLYIRKFYLTDLYALRYDEIVDYGHAKKKEKKKKKGDLRQVHIGGPLLSKLLC